MSKFIFWINIIIIIAKIIFSSVIRWVNVDYVNLACMSIC